MGELWTCIRCGGHDKPNGEFRPSVCKACRYPARYQKECEICHTPFESKRKNAKYCPACKTYDIICIGCRTLFKSERKGDRLCPKCKEEEKLARSAKRAKSNGAVTQKHAQKERSSPFLLRSKKKTDDKQSIREPSAKQKKIILEIEKNLGVKFDGRSSISAWNFINMYVKELPNYKRSSNVKVKIDRKKYENALRDYIRRTTRRIHTKICYTEFSDDELRAFSIVVWHDTIIGVASKHYPVRGVFEFRVVYKKEHLTRHKDVLENLIDFIQNLVMNDGVKI